MPLDSVKVLITGGAGLVGSAISTELHRQGGFQVERPTSRELNLLERDSVFQYFRRLRPQVVVHAATRSGGILANTGNPAGNLSDNLRMQQNVLDSCHAHDVERCLYIASSRVYPQSTPQPVAARAFLQGPPPPGLEAYAVGKAAGVAHVRALRQQFGRRYISVAPCNLYGPGDNFSVPGAHVIPMLMKRMHEAVRDRSSRFTIYGSGKPLREFLYVADMARACVAAIEKYDSDDLLNIGYGSEISIADLASQIADVVGFDGAFDYDTDKPDGSPGLLLDSAPLRSLGWQPGVDLNEGLRRTYDWFRDDQRV